MCLVKLQQVKEVNPVKPVNLVSRGKLMSLTSFERLAMWVRSVKIMSMYPFHHQTNGGQPLKNLTPKPFNGDLVFENH